MTFIWPSIDIPVTSTFSTEIGSELIRASSEKPRRTAACASGADHCTESSCLVGDIVTECVRFTSWDALSKCVILIPCERDMLTDRLSVCLIVRVLVRGRGVAVVGAGAGVTVLVGARLVLGLDVVGVAVEGANVVVVVVIVGAAVVVVVGATVVVVVGVPVVVGVAVVVVVVTVVVGATVVVVVGVAVVVVVVVVGVAVVVVGVAVVVSVVGASEVSSCMSRRPPIDTAPVSESIDTWRVPCSGLFGSLVLRTIAPAGSWTSSPYLRLYEVSSKP